MSKNHILSGLDAGLLPDPEDDNPTGLAGMFKKRYPETVFQGRAWLSSDEISPEDRSEFGRIGAAHQTPEDKAAGGRARERTAQRDPVTHQFRPHNWQPSAPAEDDIPSGTWSMTG